MILRRPVGNDIARILEIAERYDFVLPEKFENAAVVEYRGQVMAFGILRSILEAVIVTCGTPRQIVEQTELLVGQAMVDTRELNQSEIHAFVERDSFARLLSKKYGFKPPVGQALVLKME